MKTRKYHATDSCVANGAREQDAQQEIDSFLRALRSYPDRFAREPYLSFQQHLSSIVIATPPSRTDE